MERLTSFCFFCLKTVEKSKVKEHYKGARRQRRRRYLIAQFTLTWLECEASKHDEFVPNTSRGLTNVKWMKINGVYKTMVHLMPT